MMLQQQPTPRQIMNSDPGKLLLDNCIGATVTSKYIYIYIILKDNAYVSDKFRDANSLQICDSKTNHCKCSTTTEQCTGGTICNTHGACQGKYTKSYHKLKQDIS